LLRPPLLEQQKIAAILTAVDEVIESTQAQINKLKDLKTGLMQELLSKGIGHTEFKDSSVGQIPKAWDVSILEDAVFEVVVGIVVQPTQYYVESGVPALRSANVRETGLNGANLKYISHEANEKLKKSRLEEGNLVTVRTGYPGTTAVVDKQFEGANCIDVIITRPKNTIDSNYLCTWINSDCGKGQVLKAQGGLAQQHFNVGDMKRMLVALPPLNEQIKISKILKTVTLKIELINVRLDKIQKHKKALMQDLLTGKVRVKIA
jgi:type I restriction enzyme, S subunit